MSMSSKRFVFFSIYLFCSYVRVCFQLDSFVEEHVWHKALLMRYSVRLEFIRICSLSGYLVFFFVYEVRSSLFLRLFFRFVCFTPHFFLYLIHCVCVCGGLWFQILQSYFFSVCELEWFRI